MTKIDRIRQAWKLRVATLREADKIFQEHWKAFYKGNRVYDTGQDANNYRSQRYYDQAERLEHQADNMVKEANNRFILTCEEIVEEEKPKWKPSKSDRKKLKELNDFYVGMGL